MFFTTKPSTSIAIITILFFNLIGTHCILYVVSPLLYYTVDRYQSM